MLNDLICRIRPLDATAMAAARRRIDALTKPPGSLGRLEELSVQLAGITGRVPPVVHEKVIYVFAADHGVAAEGVSAYPSAVTAQMVANFLAGGAAINVLARQAGAALVVVDAGVAADIRHLSGAEEYAVAGAEAGRVGLGNSTSGLFGQQCPGVTLTGASPRQSVSAEQVVRRGSAPATVIRAKIAYGTRNFAREPAMTREQALAVLEAGMAAFQPCQLAGMGEMGIGNSTSAAAIVTAATGRPAAEVVGRGTGINDAALAKKIAVVEQAIELHRPDGGDGISLLVSVGGFEIGAMAGAMLAAAAARVPVVLDGFISTAAALVAARLCPAVKDYLIASHRSAEKGHGLALKELRLRPLLDLEMRLGEGTGAALSFHIIEAACRTMHEMATFASAGVAGRSRE